MKSHTRNDSCATVVTRNWAERFPTTLVSLKRWHLHQWRFRHGASSKRWHLPMNLDGLTIQKKNHRHLHNREKIKFLLCVYQQEILDEHKTSKKQVPSSVSNPHRVPIAYFLQPRSPEVLLLTKFLITWLVSLQKMTVFYDFAREVWQIPTTVSHKIMPLSSVRWCMM
jgi:hypothetical protein